MHERPATARYAFMVLVGAVLLAWPLLANRGVFLFSDSGPYLTAGRAAANAVSGLPGRLLNRQPAVQRATPKPAAPVQTAERGANSNRSPWYGLLAWLARGLAGLPALAAVQALWAAAVAVVLMPALGIGRPGAQLAVLALRALGTSTGVFAAIVMPDLWLGLGAAAMLALLVMGDRLGTWERWFLLATLAFAALSHKATLATLAATLAVLLLLRRAGDWRRVAAILAVAAALLAAVPVLNRSLRGAATAPPPFLLARMIGDGTAAQVLARDCAAPRPGLNSAPPRWALCRYLPHMPMTADEFLWDLKRDLPWAALPLPQQLVLAREEQPMLMAVMARHPGAQLGASLRNSIDQLANHDLGEFGVAYIKGSLAPSMDNPSLRADMLAWQTTAAGTGRFPFAPLSAFWLAVHVAALAVIGAALRWRHAMPGHLAALALAVPLLLVINAAVHGALSGSHGRYQAPLQGLTLLAAAALMPYVWRKLRRAAA